MLHPYVRFLPHCPEALCPSFQHLRSLRMEGKSDYDLVDSGKTIVSCVETFDYTNPYSVLQLRADQQVVEHCSSSKHPLSQCLTSQGQTASRKPQQKEQQGVTPGP